CRNKQDCPGKSYSRGCPANSPTPSIDTRHKAGSRPKRTSHVPRAAGTRPRCGEQCEISHRRNEVSLRRRAAAAGDKSPNHQDNHRADNCSNEARAFVRAIPAYRLAQISGYKCAYYPENRGEDESGWFVLAGG